MDDAADYRASGRDSVIALIVDHALDDLEADRIDLPTALTLTALAAWQECERAGHGRASGPFSPRDRDHLPRPAQPVEP